MTSLSDVLPSRAPSLPSDVPLARRLLLLIELHGHTLHSVSVACGRGANWAERKLARSALRQRRRLYSEDVQAILAVIGVEHEALLREDVVASPEEVVTLVKTRQRHLVPDQRRVPLDDLSPIRDIDRILASLVAEGRLRTDPLEGVSLPT